MRRLKEVYSQRNTFGVALRVTSVAIVISLLALVWYYISQLSANDLWFYGISLLEFLSTLFVLFGMVVIAQEKYKEYPRLTLGVSGLLAVWTVCVTAYLFYSSIFVIGVHLSLLGNTIVYILVGFMALVFVAFATVVTVMAGGVVLVVALGLVCGVIVLVIGGIAWIFKGKLDMEESDEEQK